jgi:predicted ATPase/Tfp pilus assembly protein PilF
MAELYRGDLLGSFVLSDSSTFEEWALLQRELYHRQAVEALVYLADTYARRGDTAQARAYARQQVALEPWREEAHRQLMGLLALEGQRSAALAQYAACREALSVELGVEPTAETTTLYEQIRAGVDISSSLPVHHATVQTVPRGATLLVGREQELNELADLLAAPDCRLVTLVGPGGIGKTRLAMRAAREQAGLFDDGVVFVPLAPLATPELLIPTLADALGFSFDSHQPPRDQLLSYLREKEMLLVLDNMEHILEASAFVIELLDRAPGVVLLVTSRERLNLRQERTYEVKGLTHPTGKAASADWASYSAVALFLQSTGDERQSELLAETEMPHILRICQMVEGMPLGVELAAAWTRVLSCQEIAAQIEHSLDTLVTRLRNVPERHRSMRAAFEHSWNLLSERERAILQGVSIFAGGFRAPAAMTVVGALAPELLSLMDKSLLSHDSSGRFQIHELLRQYALEKLGQVPGEQARIEALHAKCYAGFLSDRVHALKSGAQQVTLQEVGSEIDNVRRAWDWALARAGDERDTTLAIDVIRSSMEGLYLFYATRDWYQEGAEAFGRAVAVCEAMRANENLAEQERRLLLGQLLAYQGKCCEFIAHSDEAQRLFERSLSILRPLGVYQELALPLHGLGYMAHIKGEYARAQRYLEESLAIYGRVEDGWGIANVLNKLCLVARRQGDFVLARQRAEEGLAIRRGIGDRRGIVSSLSNLGLVHCDLGAYAEAKNVLLEALEICRQLGYRIGIGNAATGLCQATFRLGEVQAAEAYGQLSLESYRDVGDYWGVAIAYNNLGRMAAELDDHVRAKSFYQESVAIYEDIGIKSGWAHALGNLGEACYKQGEYVEARQHLDQALRIAQEIGAVPTACKTLVGLVPLLAREERIGQALETLSFCLCQSAISDAVKSRAVDLFAELSADCSSAMVREAESRGQAQELDAVIARVLGED